MKAIIIQKHKDREISVYPESLIKMLKKHWIKHQHYVPPLIGCNTRDIEEICIRQQVNFLPDLYIQFLLSFGRKSGGLKNGGDFTFPELLDFKQKFESLLPSSHCFVFMTNYDDFALFFHTENYHRDPFVYRIGVLPDKPYPVAEKLCLLSEFFIGWLQEQEDAN